MSISSLPRVAFLGEEDDPHATRPLPEDWATRPLRHLPAAVTLSVEERDLAERYRRGDTSGGYVRSQVAAFRAGPTAEDHAERRAQLARLEEQARGLGRVLPAAFVELAASDALVARLRHNNIFLTLPEALVPWREHPGHVLMLAFVESQGCGFWHLLLAPDGGHVVTLSDYPWGLLTGDSDAPARTTLSLCASSFAEWIVRFSWACADHDRMYEESLASYGDAF